MDGLDALTHRPGPGPHRVLAQVDGKRVATLADLPPERNHLLFVGVSPSPVSVRAGHYHQGRAGRPFWRGLVEAGLLDAGQDPAAADDALAARGHGLTDLVKLPTRRTPAPDVQLTAGVGVLWQKVAIWRPAAVVFVHARAASIVAGRVLAERWGYLPGVAIAGRPCLLLPGPDVPAEESSEWLLLLRTLGSGLPPA
jgi:double-stranded uracil-DNA glycosylase